MQQAQDLENQRRRLNEELSELWSQSHPVTPQKSDIDRIESVIASVESQQRQMRDALSRDLKFFSDLSPKGESFNDVMKTMWDEENRPADQREKSVPELIAELQRQNQQLSARVLELERRAAKGKK
jgi:hypothetical protein